MAAICNLAGQTIPGSGADIAVSGTGRVEGIPFVVISAPAAGEQVEQGQQVNVLSSSIDQQGIVRLELLVNDQIVNTIQLVPQPEVEHLAQQVWVPQAPGSYSLRIRAYSPANVVGESAPVVVSVNAGAETLTTTATETPSPTPSPSPSLATLTFTPAPAQQSGSDTIAMTPTPTPSEPYLVVNPQSGINVRQGPGTAYETVGLLQPGQRVEILGQSDLGVGRWWQIEFSSAPGGVGWVTASSQYSTAYNSENVAVAAAPPPPVVSAPPATATPAPAAAEPTATNPPAGGSEDIVLAAERTSIAAGECTTISWRTSNVKEVYLNGLGVAGESQVRECPDITTIYELRVVRQDGGEMTRSLTVEVQGTVPIGVIHLRPEQGVDFDRDGRVSDDGDDFRWVEDDGERRLEKWDDEDDIILIPIGFFQSLYEIKRTDCDIAFRELNDQDSIKASPNLSACIRTDEGRIGKIRFENANERVEIDWILW